MAVEKVPCPRVIEGLSWNGAPRVRQYYKGFRKKRYYFGADPDQAEDRFALEWPFIERGLPVPAEFATTGPTVGLVMDQWVESRLRDLNKEKIKPSTFAQYKRVAQFQVDQFGMTRVVAGLGPIDFARLADALPEEFGHSAAVLKRVVTITRMPWAWAYDNAILDKPVRYGRDLKAPSEGVRREQRFGRGRQIFTAKEIRSMLDQANPMMRAAIMLGINGGYTQSELAKLVIPEVDLEDALVDHLRPKTKIVRTVPLLPETVEALREYLAVRTEPRKEYGQILFVTSQGHAVHRSKINDKGNIYNRDSLLSAFTALKDRAGIKLNRSGFGKLRATFRTVADAAGDANAARRIMGHDLGQGVETSYIREIERKRLDAVVEYVKKWLFETVDDS